MNPRVPGYSIGRGRRAFALASLMWMLASAAWSQAPAPDIEFRPPSAADDEQTAAIMRDLAARLVPVYQEPDADRYLANLSVLQMAALDYTAADGSRISLRERRRATEAGLPVSRGIVYDMYARARAMEADNRAPFADSFARTFRDMVGPLDDKDAYTVLRWLETPPAETRDTLQAALDGLRNKERIDQSEAVELIRSYVSFEAYRAFSPMIAELRAEDDDRRYAVDDERIEIAHGLVVAVSVIRPKSHTGSLPALFELSRAGARSDAQECAAHGYAGVVAHSRWSPDAAEGVLPFEHDGDDARAVIAWIARQPWSDGRVGMVGAGYSAYAAWAAAKRPSPALRAIATTATMVPGVSFPMEGGIFHNSGYRWSLRESPSTEADESSEDADRRFSALDQNWYRSGRRYRDLGRIFGRPNPIFLRWLNHPSYDRFWQKLVPYREQFAALNIPVLTATGYYANSQSGALYLFSQHLRYNPRADHTLILGPYDDDAMNGGPSPALKGYQVDSAALADLRELRYRWFDHVLKGAEAPALLQDRVNYEVMGADEWRHAPSLEAMAGPPLKYYMDGAGSSGTHLLTPHRNAKPAYVQQTVSLADRSDADRAPAPGIVGKDPEPANAAVFVSEPLDGQYEFSGTFSGRLDFKVNKMDMDLILSLYEQRADGDYIRLFSPPFGFRASYARERARRHLLRAGERQQLAFQSERITSRSLEKGSRLVLVIGIDKRPDREINYGSGNDVSEESIADGRSPIKVRWFNDSYLELPLRRRTGQEP